MLAGCWEASSSELAATWNDEKAGSRVYKIHNDKVTYFIWPFYQFNLVISARINKDYIIINCMIYTTKFMKFCGKKIHQTSYILLNNRFNLIQLSLLFTRIKIIMLVI